MPNIAIPEVSAVPKPVFRLRWRFDYADGKVKRGIWNGASDRAEDSAWSISKQGLTRACIEGEHSRDYSQIVFAEVEGPRYVSAEWVAYARAGSAIGVQGTIKPRAMISGLSIITDSEKITVYCDGRIDRRDLTENEKQFKLHEHR